MVWRADLPEGNEAAKIRGLIVPYTRGKGLDLGCGAWKAYPHFIGIDAGDEHGRPYPDTMQGDARSLRAFADNYWDFVFSSHFLEHCEDTVPVLREWFRVIKPGGHLVLYLPHKNFYPNIGENGSNADHKHDFLPTDIVGAMQQLSDGWDLIEDEDRNGGAEYSFFQVYRKRSDKKKVHAVYQRPQKACLVIRYGAIGDHIMAQSVCKQLKAQGWHVTYNCNPRGEEICRHNPSIDRFIVQDHNQVPNEQLADYWHQISQRFDRVINLSESIETGLLPAASNLRFHYPDDVRRKMFGRNYLEVTHDIAGVPYEFDTFFYATDEERAWAQRTKREMTEGRRPLIVIALSGSAQHKTWPYWHILATWIMQNTDCQIVTMGDDNAVLLEQAILNGFLKASGYDDAKTAALCAEGAPLGPAVKIATSFDRDKVTRIFCRSGKLAIRNSLALVQVADLVIGPETGVLNAVGQEPNAKIVMLSHSSAENLTKHWRNTTAIRPGPTVTCYPCHRLHYTLDWCPQNKDWMSAACAAAITPESVFEALKLMLNLKRAVAPPARDAAETFLAAKTGKTLGGMGRTLAASQPVADDIAAALAGGPG